MFRTLSFFCQICFCSPLFSGPHVFRGELPRPFVVKLPGHHSSTPRALAWNIAPLDVMSHRWGWVKKCRFSYLLIIFRYSDMDTLCMIYVDLCISCVSVWTSIILITPKLVSGPGDLSKKNGSGIIRNPHVMTSQNGAHEWPRPSDRAVFRWIHRNISFTVDRHFWRTNKVTGWRLLLVL